MGSSWGHGHHRHGFSRACGHQGEMALVSIRHESWSWSSRGHDDGMSSIGFFQLETMVKNAEISDENMWFKKLVSSGSFFTCSHLRSSHWHIGFPSQDARNMRQLPTHVKNAHGLRQNPLFRHAERGSDSVVCHERTCVTWCARFMKQV